MGKKRVCNKILIAFTTFILCWASRSYYLQAQETNESTAFFGVVIQSQGVEQVNSEICISADVQGDKTGLQYKFVWVRNSWEEEWGVIQEFSENATVSFVPNKSGNYTFYVDVCGTEGEIETKTVSCTVHPAKWDFRQIILDRQSVSKAGEPIQIQADVSGNTGTLQYKFVWVRNSWEEEWGVAKEFFDENSCTWIPEKAGLYTFYVDVRDSDGTIKTKTITCSVKTDIWNYDGIAFDREPPQTKYTDGIAVTAETSGETANLQYKFVWVKNSWEDGWGVLSDFSENSTVIWKPDQTGNYQIYVDVLDCDGQTVTKSASYQIIPLQWQAERISMSPGLVQQTGGTVQISTECSGMTDLLQYKFVWMTDNWKSWGVIQDFSSQNNISWETPDEAGKYTIYVDIKDPDGKTVTDTAGYYVEEEIWEYKELQILAEKEEQIYTEIPLKAEVNNAQKNLQYKFVWMKDDWDSWGVIQDFSGSSQSVWYPKEPGKYTLYADVRDEYGLQITKTAEYDVKAAPWTLDSISFSPGAFCSVGSTITITADTSGMTEGLQYKFVYRCGDNWDDWGVIQNFSESNTTRFTVKKPDVYYIYVDIMDQRDVVFDASISRMGAFTYQKVNVSDTYGRVNEKVTITPVLRGYSENLQYKYVWMKNDWTCWGVIQDFSSKSSIDWKPFENGQYTIYVDVKTPDGTVYTSSVNYRVYSKSEIVSRVLQMAQSQIGTVGGTKYENALLLSGGSLCIGRGYWCANFVWWCFDASGFGDVFFDGSNNVYPHLIAEYYKSIGRFDNNPQVGDLAFFYWNSLPGISSNITHVGIVESVTANTITTIEGNMGGGAGQVKRFTWDRDFYRIQGYAHLNY